MRNLLVTGAYGSLGRAILTAALAAGVDRLVAYDQDEFGAYQARAALGEPPAVRWLIGDVRDRDRLRRAMAGIEMVIHGAARKWVATGVYNVDELVSVNVGGTQAVLEAATAAQVARVLVITSDKGVEPTNAYGATKFLAECYTVSANAWTFPAGTAGACLRLGNLLWSRGSVVHVWRAQAAAGKPLALTAPGMTRFGIPLSAAAALALDWAQRLRGGEVVVPALPAYALEALAACVAPDAAHVLTGERGPGEKRHETLLSRREQVRAVWLADRALAVLEPEAPSWTRPAWTGPPVPDMGWTSDTAPPVPDWALDELDPA